MQGSHDRDHHDPPRVALAVSAALAAVLALATGANAARFAPIPSPVVALSSEPPLAGGATSSAESVHHRVDAATTVSVSVDDRGRPFAVTATQRLDVHGTGDYFFTIGAPVVEASAAPGSESRPGFRTGSVVWAGFDPGRRVLAARIRLDAARAATALPLRIVRTGGSTTLVNATRVSAAAFTADALRSQLLSYLRQLEAAVKHGTTPLSGSAELTSPPHEVRMPVAVPLRVTGVIGRRHISIVLTGRVVVPATGGVALVVQPLQRVELGDLSPLDGRELLALATRISLSVARTRQYLQFLGNPDPTGRSTTAYAYRSATRPQFAAAPRRPGGKSWTTSVIAALGAVVVVLAAAYVWARS